MKINLSDQVIACFCSFFSESIKAKGYTICVFGKSDQLTILNNDVIVDTLSIDETQQFLKTVYDIWNQAKRASFDDVVHACLKVILNQRGQFDSKEVLRLAL